MKTLTCDITLDDYMVGLGHLVRTSPTIQAQFRKARAVVVGIFLSLAAGHFLVLREPVGTVMLVGMAIFFGLNAVRSRQRSALKNSRRMFEQSDSKFLGPRELTIEDRGLRSVSQFEEKIMFWDSITDIAVQGDYCIVCVGDLSAFAFVKDRVLAGNFEGFTQELMRRWSLTRSVISA